MRLFLGTFLDKELAEKISIDQIQKQFEGDLKPVKKENVHMTWVFLGDVEGEVCKPHFQEIIDKHVNLFKDLIFQSQGLKLWPPKKQPRLIVLSGVLNKEINLTNIIQDLKTLCNPDEKGNFLPHITIARFKKDKTVDKRIELPKIEKFTWKIKEFSLIQSILKSEGPSYEKVKNWEVG